MTTDRPIHTAIRLPPFGLSFDFGRMTREQCRRVESYVAARKGLRGRRDLRAELAARRAAGR